MGSGARKRKQDQAKDRWQDVRVHVPESDSPFARKVSVQAFNNAEVRTVKLHSGSVSPRVVAVALGVTGFALALYGAWGTTTAEAVRILLRP